MITGIHHATFLTGDLSRSRSFYEGVLGLCADPKRPQMEYDGVWYDIASGQQIHLMVLPDPERNLLRPQHGGRDRHVALLISNLNELMADMEQMGMTYTLSQSGRRALFCRDPDGNVLEFIET
ncbi:MAG: VOC family protein [Nitrosomonadales bacterium]|nr:VOC family protein [Nitrosomonadales bacterium]